ncbi:hypothetical protein CHO01_40120 [Cellulomonas hominis]|uniref:Uncharacterized protein n=1 Tax=Cellulomonas hominis TaxID=156981 RepID=A0A511FI19_9CELL|nr:hypothetical protein [Cellulomonas hominis]MBB5474633.1 hypothetical protein [Cellulomonas hominis]NKY07072.1 hypothetical protein [Cellulomonas hominis]GEL48896.1 hypothetical protein CHO01_40120 [Cellulomonas hominis]
MSTQPSRVPAGVSTGGQFVTQAHGEAPIDLGSLNGHPFVGVDARGVRLLRDDWVTPVESCDQWLVEDADGDLVRLQSIDDPAVRKSVDPSRFEVVRLDPTEVAKRGDRALLEQLAEEWSERDPAYGARVRQALDQLSPARDGIFTEPAHLLQAAENPTDEIGARRRRAAELATTRFLGPRRPTEEVCPATLTEARAALRARRAPGRVVELRRLDTIGKAPLEVHGHDGAPLVIINSSGFHHLHITSGTVIVYASSASGNPVTVADGATAVILAGAGRKVSVTVKDSGVAVLDCAERVHGFQHRCEGSGSLDVIHCGTDRITVRTPSSPVARRV